MARDRDIEMDRLSRIRSTGDGSSTRPATARDSGPHDMHTRLNRFIDTFRRGGGDDTTTTTSNSSLPHNRTRRGSSSHPPSHTSDDSPKLGKGDDAGYHAYGPVPSARKLLGRGGERHYDLRKATAKTASSLLARELKSRHLQMIAFGGSIGTGLFVASGKALSKGGPASVLVAYLIVGVMLWSTMQALGEMAVLFPVAGSFSAYSTRFLDPSWGFAIGWK